MCFIINGYEVDVNAQYSTEDVVKAYIYGPNRKHKTEEHRDNVPVEPGKRRPIMYTDFSKLDRNDPLLKFLDTRRPWRSSDFIKRATEGPLIVRNPAMATILEMEGWAFIRDYEYGF